jgi:hypothetical protein
MVYKRDTKGDYWVLVRGHYVHEQHIDWMKGFYYAA